MNRTICFRGKFVSALALYLFGFPAVTQAVVIDNGIPQGTLGHWSVDVLAGGETRTAVLTGEGLVSGNVVTADVVFDYFSFVDLGNGQVLRLSESAISPGPCPNNPNSVCSSGSFSGANGTINWIAESSITPGSQVLATVYTFTGFDPTLGQIPLGPMRFLQYLDEDALTISDNVFFPFGSASSVDLQLFTVDNSEVFGTSQSGGFIPGPGLQNSSFAGWAVGRFPSMRSRIETGGQSVLVDGFIDDGLPLFAHPVLGTVTGPADITSVLAWDLLDPNANTAVITTSLGGLVQAVELEPISTNFSCGSKNCPVRFRCEIPAGSGNNCSNEIAIRVRQPRGSSQSPRSSHSIDAVTRDADTAATSRLLRFSFGLANVPAGQTQNVRLKLTPRGRRIVRTSASRKLRGVMDIRNSAGFATQRIPVRIRLR